MNLPNKLTVIRILLIPIVCLLLSFGLNGWALAVFLIASVTDFLDGYLARKHHLITTFGKFLDPVADKLLVLCTMIFLCEQGAMPAWAAAIVAFRELAVDGLRLVAAGKGKVVAAGWLGKIKTNLQLLCVIFAMILPGHVLTAILTYGMALMTLVSGTDYFIKLKDVFIEGE